MLYQLSYAHHRAKIKRYRAELDDTTGARRCATGCKPLRLTGLLRQIVQLGARRGRQLGMPSVQSEGGSEPRAVCHNVRAGDRRQRGQRFP